MTRDDIIRMAQDAAIMPPNWGATENQWRSLEAFAKLVAEAEREACAKVCDKIGDEYADANPADCASAIRERLMSLHAAPPQREWKGLTDEEMMMIYGQNHEGKKYSFGRAIEAKLKEKNT